MINTYLFSEGLKPNAEAKKAVLEKELSSIRSLRRTTSFKLVSAPDYATIAKQYSFVVMNEKDHGATKPYRTIDEMAQDFRGKPTDGFSAYSIHDGSINSIEFYLGLYNALKRRGE